MADPETPTPSRAARKALKRASERLSGCVCPIPGVHNAAETALLASMARHGWIDQNFGVPVITDAGRAAIARAKA